MSDWCCVLLGLHLLHKPYYEAPECRTGLFQSKRQRRSLTTISPGSDAAVCQGGRTRGRKHACVLSGHFTDLRRKRRSKAHEEAKRGRQNARSKSSEDRNENTSVWKMCLVLVFACMQITGESRGRLRECEKVEKSRFVLCEIGLLIDFPRCEPATNEEAGRERASGGSPVWVRGRDDCYAGCK